MDDSRLQEALHKLQDAKDLMTELTMINDSVDSIENLGAKVKQARQVRNLNQMQLAEITGLNQKTISKLENGELGLSLSSVLTLTKALGIQLCIK